MKLDIGSGCAQVPADYIGLDVTRSPSANIVASGCFLPFKDGAFSHVRSRRCLSIVQDDLAFLKEIRRVTEPEGTIEIQTASWRGWLYYQIRWLFQKKNYPIFHVYTAKRLRTLFGKAGYLHFSISTKPSTRRFGYDFVVQVTRS